MAYITLNSQHFKHNIAILAKRLGGRDKIALVLKDNAYGHGLVEMAALAQKEGIGKAVVRCQVEAQRIGEYFDEVLVLAEIPKECLDFTRYTINDIAQIPKFPKGCAVELKVDTGMHRNGIDPKELPLAFSLIKEAGLDLKGVFSHHRSADTLGSEWFWQAQNFKAVVREAKKLSETYGFEDLRFHDANSAAVFRYESYPYDIARIGIAAYGCLELDRTFEDPGLKPVLSLYAQKIATRTLEAGQKIGYNATYESLKKELVSTYDLGYADGLMRSASNRFVTPDGSRILGRISMDNISVDSQTQILEIFNDVRSFAAAADTISYEVLVRLASYLERRII